MKTVGKIFAGIACASIGIGVIILIICLGIGKGGISNTKYIGTYNETVTGVTSLDFDFQCGAVIIKQGDVFEVDAKGIYEEGFESTVENGVWKIRQNLKNEDMSLIGLADVHVLDVWWADNSDKCIITITLPYDFEGNSAKIKLAAGELNISSLNVNTADLEVKAGTITGENISCADKLSAYVAAGEISLEDVDSGSSELECNAGSIYVDGRLLGMNKIDCSMGNIQLEIDGDENSYGFEFDCAMGAINVNGRSLSRRDYQSVGSGVENIIDANCSMGEIDIHFSK